MRPAPESMEAVAIWDSLPLAQAVLVAVQPGVERAVQWKRGKTVEDSASNSDSVWRLMSRNTPCLIVAKRNVVQPTARVSKKLAGSALNLKREVS